MEPLRSKQHSGLSSLNSNPGSVKFMSLRMIFYFREINKIPIFKHLIFLYLFVNWFL